MARLRVLQLPHRADLDDSKTGRRKSRRDLTRFVEVPGLDEKEAAELLLRLGERAIGRRDLAAANTDRPGRPRRLQRVRDDVVTALLDLLVVFERRVDER